jgi:hypothetical protein
MSIIRLEDFKKSVYKFVKEQFAESNNYPVYYGDITIDSKRHNIWIYCNFSELNVDTGKFSVGYIDIITRIASIEEYNKQLVNVADELKEIFVNAAIDLYDFSVTPETLIPNEKIIVMRQLKNQEAIPVFERIAEFDEGEVKELLQAIQITIKVKLLKNFSRSRVIG